MKKFLFTLAALLMVGSGYAANYMYIEDFEVTPEFLAQTSGKAREMTLDVKANFTEFVSGFQVWINSPEGITNRDALAGEAMTQDGYTRTGNPITRSCALSVSDGVDIFISAWTENDWYYPEGLDPDEDDPVAVGSVKWAPGVYNMFTLTVRFAQTFEGGDIMVITEPACAGTDPRGECCPKDEHEEVACHVTVAGAVTPDPAPVPTVTMSDTYEVSAVCADHEVVLMINGQPVANPYQITQTYEDQSITFTAYTVANADEAGNSTEVTFVANVPAMQQPTATTPVITFDEDGSGLMITIENWTEYTITVDGVQVDPTRDGEHYYYVEKVYDKAQEVVVYAKNAPGYPYLPAEDTKTYNLPAKEKAQNSKPSVTYSYENGELTVWAYGCTEENVAYTLYCDGVEYTGTFPIAVDAEEGYNHTWTATAVSPTTTVSELSDPCEIVIDPVIPTPTTPDPTISVAYDNDNEKVIITVEGEGTVTATVTYADGPVTYNDEDGDGIIVIEIPYGDDVTFVNVVATAQNAGATPGGANEPLVEIPAKTPAPVQTPAPTIDVVTNADGTVTVTVTGNGTLNVTIEGYDLELDVITYTGASPYEITLQQAEDAQEVTVSATAQAQGELVSDPAVKTFEIEAKPTVYPETCVAPNGDYVIIDKEKALVTITNNEPGATVHYVVTLNGVTVEEGTFTGDTWEYVADGVGDWVVSCVATLPGKNDSQPGGVFFPIAENQWPTAVDEMMAGKTISNVRYFNVAGQEMQEANGMTIVVTTYTDGTKSAVKVMK